MTSQQPGKVTSVKPDSEVWRIALAHAGGDASRLEVVDSRTVIVRNTPK